MSVFRLNLKEEKFTATNKKTGKTSVFKSKNNRDAAVKAGTHAAIDTKKDTDTKVSSKANIFDKPSAETPKVNISKKRSDEFFNDSKAGEEIKKLLGGKWNKNKVENYLDNLGDGNDVRASRILGFIAKNVGIDTNKFKTDGELETAVIDSIENLYKLQGNQESDTPKVDPIKLTQLMPNADKKTFNNKSDISKISDSTKRKISMKIDKLAELTKQAKEKGEAAPNFNLCKITVPGTNLYCKGNAGIPREEMPQFKGKPTPGSPASKMATGPGGEVDTEPMFKKMLKEKGIKIAETEIPSDSLKATQSELVGSKVAGMAKALDNDPNHPAITAPIYVSRDGYVVDGHHRWAAVTSAAIKAGKPANMKVIVIDMDIKDVIPMANNFAEEIGVAAKKADANKEEPKSKVDLSKYDTSGETDYFEEYDELPDNVKDLIDKHFSSGDGSWDYPELKKIKTDFEKEGWTFDFGLDGSPYELKPKVKNESKSTRLTSILNEVKKIRY